VVCVCVCVWGGGGDLGAPCRFRALEILVVSHARHSQIQLYRSNRREHPLTLALASPRNQRAAVRPTLAPRPRTRAPPTCMYTLPCAA